LLAPNGADLKAILELGLDQSGAFSSEEVVKTCSTALKEKETVAPSDLFELYLTRGSAYSEMGNFEDSKRAFEQAQRFDPRMSVRR